MLHHLINFLKTNDNQFGFIPNHGTDMSVFLLKQVASLYVSRDTPVFAMFLDASKAFDKVDHDLLTLYVRAGFSAFFQKGGLFRLKKNEKKFALSLLNIFAFIC